ncbi:MAG: 16S rRNA (cytidine(1402)-2'-O)-methyltransferase [Thermoactinomyces sp.]
MKKQKSFVNKRQEGILYVVGTPIGNLQDFSPRAKEILSEADLIAAEDTRHTLKLLNAFGIRTSLISYHEHNQKAREPELIERLKDGLSIALVSDAGMPGISDPGEALVKKATDEGIPVVPVPGPNAALAALVASGLPAQPFVFLGFLPREKKERKKELERWRVVPATLIFYEAPHRLTDMLEDLLEVLGDRRVAVCRELTKKHEEWLRGNLSECLEYLKEHKGRGEFTIVIEGADPAASISGEKETGTDWSSLSIRQHVDQYMEQGLNKKEAIFQAARDRSLPKREVYNAYHKD